MSVSDDTALRAFLARLLGWDRPRAVELALRSVELAAERWAALVLCGVGDMVPIAHALHLRTLGADRPFVVCDPRRANVLSSVRSPANLANSAIAFDAARGGSLCVRAFRLPPGLSSVVARLRATDEVSFVVCARERDAEHHYLARPAPIRLPPLAERAAELDRAITEYAADAIAELGAPPGSFSESDHAWVRQHAATSLAEIEKATLRLVALRTSRNLTDAATRLAMAPVSLMRWVDRRKLRRVLDAEAP